MTGSRKRDHFADLLQSRYRHLNSDNKNKTFFADLSFLLANGSRIFPLPLYQILKVLYHRQCQYTQANEYHFDGANSIETTNH